MNTTCLDQPADPKGRPIAFRPALHIFAWVLMLSVFMLIAIGGTVTSRGAGMAVPDWPQTFGHNMFAVPWDLWVDFDSDVMTQSGAFYEHSHRLKGSWVGMLCIGMAIWLWITQKNRRWLRWMGIWLLGLVIVQGLMGGFRVTENSLLLAFVHGVVGQIIFGITVLIVAATGKLWIAYANTGLRPPGQRLFPGLRVLTLIMIGLLIIQLVLGAWVRHAGAGLAIPDFPMSYGQWTPPLTHSGLEAAEARMGVAALNGRSFTVEQVFVHFMHRVGALVVMLATILLVGLLIVRMSRWPTVVFPAITFFGLIVLQALLGVSVVLTGRHPEIATIHQSLGAAVLGVSVFLAIRVHLVAVCRGKGPQTTDETTTTCSSTTAAQSPNLPIGGQPA